MTAACAGGLALVATYLATGTWVRSSAPVTLERAREALQRRDNSGVRDSLQWLLWFDPDNSEALLLSGVSLNADQRFPEAIAVLERIPIQGDHAGQAGIALAASLILDGQWQRAGLVLSQLVARFPDSRDAHDRLVRLYLRELRKREAIRLLADRWRRFPDELQLLPDLLELQVKVITPHDRIEALIEADRAHPHQPSVVLALARAYALMGRSDAARAQFQNALQLQPDDAETRLAAAEFFLDSGDSLTAQSLLTKSAARGTAVFDDSCDDERYWFLQCRLAEQAGDLSAAESLLKKALAIRPDEERLLFTQAGLLRQLGHQEAAARAARRATELAEARKQAMILSDKFDRGRPEPTLAAAIANLLETLGHADQAAGWRQIASRFAPPQSAAGPHPSPSKQAR